jgi:hypothetical protein
MNASESVATELTSEPASDHKGMDWTLFVLVLTYALVVPVAFYVGAWWRDCYHQHECCLSCYKPGTRKRYFAERRRTLANRKVDQADSKELEDAMTATLKHLEKLKEIARRKEKGLPPPHEPWSEYESLSEKEEEEEEEEGKALTAVAVVLEQQQDEGGGESSPSPSAPPPSSSSAAASPDSEH